MTVVTTSAGPIEGGPHRGGLRFAGVPYGAPPTGPRRFAAPEPAEPWTDVRPATGFGPVAMQNPSPLETTLGSAAQVMSEDCLYLNVFTPSADAGARPVMVWIHGGAYIFGSGSSPLYDAGSLVERGDVVVVTVNYRLGSFGFLHLGDVMPGDPTVATSGLNGTLDQVLALRWVQDNIASFGGDPDNVTVFGESAGAFSVSTLIALPQARGLFHRAIAQSGAGHHVASREVAESWAVRFCEIVGHSTVEELRALDPQQMLDAQAQILTETLGSAAGTFDQRLHSIPFSPVVDGHHLPTHPYEAVLAGHGAPVDLITGTTAEEFRMFSLLSPPPADDDELITRIRPVFGEGTPTVLATYRNRLGPDATTKDVFDALMTDGVFRVPVTRLAEANHAAGNRSWMYRFTYRTPVYGGILGSCHALELPFVFDKRTGALEGFVGPDSPDRLAIAMQEAWLAFARAGDPNVYTLPVWPPVDDERTPVMFLGEEFEVVDDPDADELGLWATVF